MASVTAYRHRYRQIAEALARHGLGYLIGVLGLERFIPFHRGLLGHPRRPFPCTRPEHLRLALEELGTTSSVVLLALGGSALVVLGLGFAVWRPPLLPEDERSIGMSAVEIHAAVPGLANWLQKVFWVLGGFVISTGLLTIYVAVTTFRRREVGAAHVVALSGATSIGWMAAVNVLIRSDYRGFLLGIATLWAGALAIFARRSARP